MKQLIIKNTKLPYPEYNWDTLLKESEVQIFINRNVEKNVFGKPERWVRAKVWKEFAVLDNGDPNDGYFYPDETYEESDVLETEERPKFQDSEETETWVKLKAEYTIEISDYVPPVPTEVTMRQARLALIESDLYDTIQTAIENSNDQKLKIEWEYSQTVRRDWSNLIAVTEGLGMTSEQVDNLFRLADTL